MKRFVSALFAAVLLGAAASAATNELYGKPLRGLSAVPIASVVARPADYAGKTIRVSGQSKGDKGRPAVGDGTAVLRLVTEGFSLPDGLGDVRLTAEGQVRAGDSGTVFVATGVEVAR